MTRRDVHRPSQIIPADYEFVAFEYIKTGSDLGACQFLMSERQALRAHMARTGGTYSGHEHGGNCAVCGSANAIYTAQFYHAKTNSYVRTGLDCAAKLECRGVEAFRRNVDNALEARAGKAKAQAILEAANLSGAWPIYMSEGTATRDVYTVRDIVGRLVRYGSASTKALEYLRTLLDRIARQPEIDAQRAAEAEAAAPVPVTSERMTVVGEVLSVRVPDYKRGECGPVRMLVKADAGWKVWGSRPSSIGDVNRGDRVEFMASVKRSNKDAKFGFYSRPTKARIINSGAAG